MDRVSKSKRRKDDQQLVQNLKAKVDELTAKVRALESQNVDQAAASASSSTTTTSLPTRSAAPRMHNPSPHSSYSVAQVPIYASTGFVQEMPEGIPSHDTSSTSSVPPLPHETALVVQTGARAADPDQSVSIQDLFNHLLGMALVVDRSTICMDDALSSDALIRGILYGWDTILSAPYCCPIWEVLSRFDSLIFGFTSILTRFSTLKTIRTFMLVC
jgi:hypothetical protein